MENASVAGIPLKVEHSMQTAMRGRFARIDVKVGFSKSLVLKFLLDGEWQNIAYEGIPHICFTYGRISHMQIACPKNRASSSRGPTPLTTEEAESLATKEAKVAGVKEFGPWMLVARKPRQSSKANGAVESRCNGLNLIHRY
ncbi:hypothetical protein Scep_024768 [Stephania cephalantha]|uniref:Uncharacterized protein n=1 Tax=Stephania cephalantha TaxID=152367 RepID=A0AAP0HU04_9MAGN